MFIISNIILNTLYYLFSVIKYISTNLFGLNSIIIDNILKQGIFGYGIGAYYNYGYYAYKNYKRDLTLKFSLKIVI